jgi:hypothetical protein
MIFLCNFFLGIILQKKFEKQITLGKKYFIFSMYNYAKNLPTFGEMKKCFVIK